MACDNMGRFIEQDVVDAGERDPGDEGGVRLLALGRLLSVDQSMGQLLVRFGRGQEVEITAKDDASLAIPVVEPLISQERLDPGVGVPPGAGRGGC